MTHPDPAPSDSREPKRTPRFNALVVLLVVALFVVAGAYVWMHWSADDDSAADNAAGHPVRPAEVPPPDAGSLSPEGAEAAGVPPRARVAQPSQ